MRLSFSTNLILDIIIKLQLFITKDFIISFFSYLCYFCRRLKHFSSAVSSQTFTIDVPPIGKLELRFITTYNLSRIIILLYVLLLMCLERSREVKTLSGQQSEKKIMQ
jgi:hypothetical protein